MLHACAHNPTGVDPKVSDILMDEARHCVPVLTMWKFQEIPLLNQERSLEILMGRVVSETSWKFPEAGVKP